MKYIKLFVLFYVNIFFFSCDSALELNPKDIYGLNNYWKSPEQCSRFMQGLYFRMRSRSESRMQMGELRGGTLSNASVTSIGEGAANIEAIRNNLSEQNPTFTNWCDFYMDIYQINHAIEKISTDCPFFDDKTRNIYLGQLYGMRAFYYFYLLRTWGGVPLCDRPDVLHTGNMDVLNKPRSSEQEIYEFVREDVNRSAECYADIDFSNYNGKNCYWNKSATYCLKAEVYMWGAKVKPLKSNLVFSVDPKTDLQSAKELLTAIESLYCPNPKFIDAFSPYNKDANKEIIFAIRYKLGEASNYFSNFTYNPAIFTKFFDQNGIKMGNVLNIGGGAMRYEYSEEFYNLFDERDSRRDGTFLQFYSKDEGGNLYPVGRLLCKFIGEPNNGNNQFTNDVPVWRYMDIVLMLAEISNDLGQLNETQNYIKIVRNRAYGVGNAPNVTETDHEEIEKIILDERKKEFVCEGKIWFDLRRMLGGKEALNLVGGNELKLLWPIDAGVLSKDNLIKQNEGYSL